MPRRSSATWFAQRILVNTTDAPMGANAQKLFDNPGQWVETHSISFSDLTASSIDWSRFGHDGAVRLQAPNTIAQMIEEPWGPIHGVSCCLPYSA